MDNMICYVKLFSTNGQIIEKPYLSEIEVKVGDKVIVEGVDLPLYVNKVIKDLDNLSFDINSLHKVIKIDNESNDMYMDKDISNIDYLNIFNVELKYDIKDYFSYADYHFNSLYLFSNNNNSPLSFIEKIILSNKENRLFDNIKVEFNFDNDIFKSTNIILNKIYANESKNLEIPFISIDYDKYNKINELIVCNLEIVLKTNDNILKRYNHKFKLLPISNPSINVLKDERLYLKYITPNNKIVNEFTLNIKRDNNMPFIAYQNENINDTYKEIKDVYNYIHNYGIQYYNPPKGSVEDKNLSQQRLRLPSMVIKDKMGTCIDLALFFISVYESLGFDTILVILDSHAYMGVYLKDKNNIKKDIFNSGIINKPNILYNYVTSGLNELILIETTLATKDKNYSLDDVIDITSNNLLNYKGGFNAYDVNYFHKYNSLYRPIPLSNLEYESFLELKPNKIIENKEKVFEEINYNDILESPIKDRFTFWETKLLDLDESNPLVNFKLSTSNCIRVASDLNIEDYIYDNDSFKVSLYQPENKKSLYECLLDNEKPGGYIYSSDSDKIYGFGLNTTLKNIIKKSKEAQDETGAPTIYLVLGTLKFKRLNNEDAIAPFMVLPIKAIKNKLSESYEISYDIEDLILNKTFFEYYKLNNPDFNFDYLYNINKDIKYKDICHKFKLENSSDVSLDSNHFLITNLSFSHYMMWLDIHKRQDELKKNKIIDSIVSNENKINEPELIYDGDKDELENYNEISSPLPYDSTQLKAVIDANRGRSFILDGPPGTGKSQTIVNIMINAIKNNKTVLFVAEKKAALDVVYKRLENIKLDRFALELHSNKANKTDFFKKLEKSMNLGETKKPSDYENKIEQLNLKKLELLDIINRIHKNKYYYSLYECIEIYLSNNSTIKPLDSNLINIYNEDIHNEIIDLLDKIINISCQITDFDNSLIKILGIKELSYYEKDNLRLDFSNLLNSFDNSYYDIIKFIKNIGIDTELKQGDIKNILRIIDNTFNQSIYYDKLSNYKNIDDLSLINGIFDKINSLNEYKKKHDYIDFNKISNIDYNLRINELKEDLSFFKRLKRNKEIKEELSNILTINKIEYEFDKYYYDIKEYNELLNSINENKYVLDLYVDDFDIQSVELIKNKFNDTLKYSNLLNSINNLLDYNEAIEIFLEIKDDAELSNNFNNIKNNVISYQKLENEFTNKYKLRYELLNIDKYIELLNNNYPFSDFINMAAINKIIDRLNELNLTSFINLLINNEIKVNELKNIYIKSLANELIERYFNDSSINYFNSSSFDSDILKYRELINDYSKLTIEEISYLKSNNLIHGNINYKDSSPLGRLKKSIMNGGRGVTIRDTLLDYDNIIRSYFPIFLMSPLSISKYLSIDTELQRAIKKFDMVIFDEASQIPVHEAIGAIARGKSLIVAGDPMQMPPSSYFRSNIDLDDEDIMYQDSDSLLDECMSIGMPRIQLKFHYRSHHESLIDYSNKTYYDNNLYTFPSSNQSEFKINFKHINLNDTKSNSNLSKEEIDEIISTIKNIYSDEKNKDKSLGIIVFNTIQKDLLEESLNNYLLKDKSLQKLLDKSSDKGEPFFIKSLENVQGDERDIIIISIGFRVSKGHPYINGPLTRINGEKRLNVAISRSKDMMYVISTVKYSDFSSDDKINSKGVRDLKYFLKYIETKGFDSNISNNESNGLVDLLSNDLRKLNLDTITNVGNSNIKIDIAVKAKEDKDYSLGIIIDLNHKSNDLSLRDRLYVNEYMLNNLKWKIVNVYSVEYFKDKNLTIKRILDALDKPFIKEQFKLNPDIIKEDNVEIPQLKKKMYLEAKIDNKVEYDKENDIFYLLDEAISNIVETESPVSFDRIKQLIRLNSNIKVINKYISDIIYLKLKNYNKTLDQNDTYVYWNTDNNYMDYFRYDTPLDIYEIPKEEILSCMKQIIDIQGSLSLPDLYKEVLKEFNIKSKTLTNRIKERLDYCFKYGKDNNIL